MIYWLSIVDSTTGRRLLVIQQLDRKESLAIEDDTPYELPNRSAWRLIRTWMRSVRRDNP